MSNKKNETKTPETPTTGADEALKAENDALKAELEALKAQAEKDAAALAKLKTAPSAGVAKNEPDAPSEERVEITVPRGYANDEPNLLIAINGVNYLLPRGKTSKVPKFVADEFYRSQRAQGIQDDHIGAMQQK